MLLGLGAQVFQVEVAIRMRLHRNNLETRHDRRLFPNVSACDCTCRVDTYSRVRAVSADGDKTDIPVTLAARLVIRLDDRQPGVFASSAGVGLK